MGKSEQDSGLETQVGTVVDARVLNVRPGAHPEIELHKVVALRDAIRDRLGFEEMREVIRAQKALIDSLVAQIASQRGSGASADQELGSLRERTRAQERTIVRLRLRLKEAPGGSDPWAALKPLISTATAALFPEATLTAIGARDPRAMGRDLWHIGKQQAVEDYASLLFQGAAEAAAEGGQ